MKTGVSLKYFVNDCRPKKQKKSSTLFDYRAHKNEAVNILGFKSIWISL